MHRAYQPILPCGNKYLQQKWDKATYEEHKKKIQTAKPVVDTSMPPTYGHLHLKLRKLKLEKERLSIIERDNYLLLEKISYIMRTKGRIDNKNYYEAKSLNRRKREQELLRITQENGAILERIIKCEPQYKVQKWNEDWQQTVNYMNSIARYPRGLCSLQDQKEQMFYKKTSKPERQKDKQRKDVSLTSKPEEEDLVHQKEKELNNDQRENPIEKV
uniref:CFAP97 domain containing 2 n=1 Tax=Salvator merianae TaxID=96440 RepID=A0A8D0AWN1_SALMN